MSTHVNGYVIFIYLFWISLKAKVRQRSPNHPILKEFSLVPNSLELLICFYPLLELLVLVNILGDRYVRFAFLKIVEIFWHFISHSWLFFIGSKFRVFNNLHTNLCCGVFSFWYFSSLQHRLLLLHNRVLCSDALHPCCPYKRQSFWSVIFSLWYYEGKNVSPQNTKNFYITSVEIYFDCNASGKITWYQFFCNTYFKEATRP